MRRSPSTPPAIPGLRFERQLGAGGFSDVFLYEQQLPRRQVAVKVLLAEHLTDQTREAFVAEANLMAQLSAHPYIVTIYTADVSPDGRPYLAMEYCAGASLAEQAKLRRFAVADALRTGVRLASAVATAHAAGILHRDIKPANVLTNAYGWPALTDFGISQAVELELPAPASGSASDELGSTGASGTQTVGLSIPWSPPEMFEDEPKPDVRSDVFSLAATLYTLLAGRTPFEVPGQPNGAADLISRIERGSVTPLDRDDVPRSLTATLQKGLARDRSARFDSAVDFARALQRVEMELAYAPTPIDVPNLLQPQQPQRPVQGGAAAETRVRQLTTVDAQPVAPSVSTEHAVVTPSARPADETVVRGGIQRVSPEASAAVVPSETIRRERPLTMPEEPDAAGVDRAPVAAPRRRRTGWILLAAAVVVVVGGVAAGVLVPGLQPTPQPSASAAGTGAPIQLDSVPTPAAVSVTPNADGSAVTFAWSNPDPVDGDRFVWQRTDGPAGAVKTPTDDATVTVGDVAPGSNVCISIVVVRSGVTSAEPLQMCLHG